MRHFCGNTHSSRLPRPVVLERPAGPTHAEIARIAYSYWEARGRQGGSPEEDWYRAEREWAERNGRG
jgi:hypothetical protein